MKEEDGNGFVRKVQHPEGSSATDVDVGQREHPVDPGSRGAGAASSPGESGRIIERTFAHDDVVSGRYRIGRCVGVGGMGEVYEAEDLELGGNVALKTVRADVVVGPSAIERFKREIQLARKVTHPNVCRIFDVGYHREDKPSRRAATVVPFLTMELLSGETLAQLLDRRGRLSEAEAQPIMEQVAGALDAAHKVGVVHRDFKTSNVILVEGPGAEIRAVVTDFGLARASSIDSQELTSVTATGIVIGTPAYMAPEQVEGGTITAAADIYALGIVIYETLAGIRPFTGDTPMSVAVKRLSARPASPRTHVPEISSRCEQVILRCLERNPSDRFADAGEVLRALRGEAVAPARRVVRLRRKRLSLVAVGLLGLLLIATVVLWVRQAAHTSRTPSSAPSQAASGRSSVAVLWFRNSSGRPADAWLSTAIAEMLSTELAAGQRLNVIPGENVARMRADLALADADSFAPDTLARVRQNLGADLLVLGSYLSTGDASQIRVDLRVQDAITGEIVFAAPKTGEDLIALMSDLGAQLRAKLGAGELSAADRATVRASLASNTEATRWYADGLSKLRIFDAIGARDSFLKAVTSDPQFPLAHAQLAAAWSALGYDAKAGEAAKKAFDLSGALAREDRLMIEGRFHEMSKEWARACETYGSLFGIFPDNLDYGLRLARCQASAGRPQEALKTIEILHKLPAPSGEDPRIDLTEAEVASAKTDYHHVVTAAGRAAEKGGKLGARLLRAQAKRLEGSGYLNLGERAKAADAYAASRALFAEAGDRNGAARALQGVGYVLLQQNNLDGAQKIFEDALAIHRQTGDKSSVAIALNHLAGVLHEKGDLQRAQAMYEESISVRKEIGDRKGLGLVLGNLGYLVLCRGDLPYAERLFREELDIAREVGARGEVAVATYRVGVVLLRRGELTEAASRLDDASRLTREVGDREIQARATSWLARLAIYRDDPASARKKYEEGEAIARTLADKVFLTHFETELASLGILERHAQAAITSLTASLDAIRRDRLDLSEAPVLALLARAHLDMGQLSEAQAAVKRAEALPILFSDSEDAAMIHITSARVAAASGRLAEALKGLQDIIAEARKTGSVPTELEARLALGEVQIWSGDLGEGAKTLSSLDADARASGFALYAREAAESAGRSGGRNQSRD